MMYRNKFLYFLMRLDDVTQDMLDKSQNNSISTTRISKPNLSGERFAVLKFKCCNIPLVLEADFGDEKISHDDLEIELGGSIWQI